MFDQIAGTPAGRPRRRQGPLAISFLAHVGLIVAVAIPAMLFVGEPPNVPTMMAFVVHADAALPPPPPPPPPAAAPATPTEVKSVAASPSAAPLEAPATIAPESGFEQTEVGVIGGVEGGITGGVVGGIVGGIDAAPPPPPAPPPPRRAPVRIGGQISEPRLLTRVNPHYPELAARARLTGVVILEATVDEEGVVQEVKVLRSVKFLDESSIEALKQWRYEPLTLNGYPMPFVLTVSMVFSVEGSNGR